MRYKYANGYCYERIEKAYSRNACGDASRGSLCERFDRGDGIENDSSARIGVARRASVELNGDVLSRASVRRMEIEEAHEKVFEILEGKADVATTANAPDCVPSQDEVRRDFACVVATTPAWRGPLVHAALFNTDGRMLRYKIVDPSAHNWQGLAWALRGEQISNFPICNKSFNLSYCGTDR